MVSDLSNIFKDELSNTLEQLLSKNSQVDSVSKLVSENFDSTQLVECNVKFDLKFLNYYLEALNLEPITNYICTLEMLKQVKSYNGKNKKLETACSYYNIENKNAHRADSDTLATAKLFLTIKDKIYFYTEGEFLEMLEEIVNATSKDKSLKGKKLEKYLDTLVDHFIKITEHPKKGDLIFYPNSQEDGEPENILKIVKEWRRSQGLPLFKDSK